MTGERRAAFDYLANNELDLLVVGGGINGAGIIRDAALRGLKVGLVEKTDFASGTSSKSSKLVHGGLRYLEHAQLRLVFEGTNERALLMRLAPHLVRPLEFLLPCYKRDKPGLFVLDCGLWIYDALSKFSSPKLHRTVRAGRLAKLEPTLKKADLEGGILYYDAMTDDARLTLENVIDARKHGACALNYTEVVRLVSDGDRVVGAEVRDRLSPGAAPLRVRAKVVISATGAWSDAFRALLGEPPILAATKGVHLIVDAARLRINHAVVMKERRRVVFCIPWGDRTVIGTTDTFFNGHPDDVACDADDVAYLLALVNAYFPDAQLTPDDVLATYAGLRPLVKPAGEGISASDVSREHTILHRAGLVSVAGGKLTTYRRMSAEVVEEAAKQLPGGLKALAPLPTADRPLPGAEGLPLKDGYAAVHKLADELAATGAVDAVAAKQLAQTYGVRARALVARVQQDPALGARLEPELPHILAQVDVACLEEQAETVTDVLERRLSILLRSRDQGLSVADAVAQRMATLLGWTPAQAKKSADDYRATVAVTRRFREAPRASDKQTG